MVEGLNPVGQGIDAPLPERKRGARRRPAAWSDIRRPDQTE